MTNCTSCQSNCSSLDDIVWSRDHYAALLEAGQLVGVAVGGAEEALFDWDYDLLWGQRKGFAKLALGTGEEGRDARGAEGESGGED